MTADDLSDDSAILDRLTSTAITLQYPDAIEPQFFAGEMVTLKSGGPAMTVSRQMSTREEMFICMQRRWPEGAVCVEWLDSVGHRHSHRYHPAQLMKIKAEEKEDAPA